MAPPILKFAAVIVVLWFIVLCYLGPTVFQLVEDSRKSATELDRISKDLDSLKRDNIRLRESSNSNSNNVNRDNDANNLKNERIAVRSEVARLELSKKLSTAEARIKELESQLEQKSGGSQEPSVNYEILRRRIANQIKEMWFLVSASYSKLEKTIPETAKSGFTYMLQNFGEIQRITERDFDELVTMDGAQKLRDNIADRLSNIIQKRLHKLQNPKDCGSARKLVCSLNKGCGYGCQAHHVLYCFIVAYATKRTLIIDSSGWRYSSKGWKSYFKDVSDTCTHYSNPVEWNQDHEKAKVVHIPIVDSLFPRPKQMPQNVPREFYDQIRSFHGHPFVWWIGQFSKYLFQYSPAITEAIEQRKKDMKFNGPIVGIQVRRTDKVNLEAAFHAVEEYMYWVDLYYKGLELTQQVQKKRVFLATDDSTVLKDAMEKYPEYEFLSDNEVSKSAGLGRRYSDLSLRGVVTDIELLAQTDFLVCTFSSQVCRLAYEIMNNKYTDASKRFRSLDDIYYFGGQEEHRVKAIWPHEAKSRRQIGFKVGDVIGIAGNHWDGQSKGLHHNTQKDGLYPSFKVEDIHDVADFVTYGDEDDK